MRPFKIVTLSALACFVPLLAQPATSLSSFDPLLRVHGTRLIMQTVFPPGTRAIEDFDFIIAKSGGLSSFMVRSTNGGAFGGQAAEGGGSPSALSQLKSALAEGHIGSQASCSFETLGELVGPYEITWYGKGARRNSFQVMFGPQGTSNLPPCPDEMEGLIRAINEYEMVVRNTP